MKVYIAGAAHFFSNSLMSHHRYYDITQDVMSDLRKFSYCTEVVPGVTLVGVTVFSYRHNELQGYECEHALYPVR